MSQNITLKDIATILNLSISTVSKSLKDSNEISKNTKKRVLELAKEYHYKPNQIAMSLKTRKTKTIGVIIPDILNYYFVKVLLGIEKEARLHNYKVITCLTNESYCTEVENIELLANGSVDGIVMSLSRETQKKEKLDHIKALLFNKIPIVLFDRVSDGLRCNKIVNNDFIASYNATKYLIQSGSKNPALFAYNIDLSVVKLRIKGFLTALEEFLVLPSEQILELSSLEDAEIKIFEFLKSNPKIDSVFSIDERLAIKTLKVVKKMGYNIPMNFKIIGFSNGELSEEFSPSLSTVELYPDKVGKIATSTIIDIIENTYSNDTNKTITVQSKLILREST